VTERRVRIEHRGHVAVVTLSRPDRHNALDAAMFEGIVGAAEEVGAAAGVRAVVLHGEGPSFCSGLDVASFLSGPLSPEDLLAREDGNRSTLAQRTCTDWIDLPVPVIAAVHGVCFGGGLQIALGADIRIAAADARLSIMESKWGLVPDMGITSTLPRLVRADVAKELTFTGRVLSGRDAAELGLVTRVADDPLAAALDLAEQIAARSPDAIRAAKRLYDTSWHAPVEEGLRLESDLQSRLMGSANQIEAVRAGMAREPASFTDAEAVAADARPSGR
jgi:enoyl-CoA hydratase/carnithine racemase